MKEARLFDSSLTHYWTFQDNMSVVDNPRVKATVFGNPTFKDGVATFNGSTDYYKLKTLINLGTKYTIEIKAKAAFTTNGNYIIGGYTVSNFIFDVFNASNRIVHKASGVASLWDNVYQPDLLWHTYTFTRIGTSLSLYIDGIFISTKILSSNTNLYLQSIGALENGTYRWNGSIEYIKIWNRQLSASEVKNNVAGKTYRTLPYVSSEKALSIINNPDFTTWSLNNSTEGAGSRTSNSITRLSGDYGVYLNNVLTTGKLYKYTIIGNQTAGTLSLSDLPYTTPNGLYINQASESNINRIGYFIAYTGDLLLYKLGSGTFTYTTFKIEEVLQSSKNTLFHINSDNGVIRDLTGKTSPIPTNVLLPKIGSNKAVMKFDGLSGNINLGTQTLLGDITFMGWVKNITKGEGGAGQLVYNGQFSLRNSSAVSNFFAFSRNNESTIITSAINTLVYSRLIFFCITSTSTGITNFYIGDKNNSPTLSGTANQSAGTPITGTTCYLGNRVSDDRTLNGWLNDVRMEQSILTIEEITQYYSSTKYKYQ